MEQCIFIGLGLTGLMFFCHWFYYCLGKPLADSQDDIDVGGIFNFIPRLLADRRLRRHTMDAELRESFVSGIAVVRGSYQKLVTRKDYIRHRITVGREFFTWEKTFLCPVCLHWWLSLVLVLL